MKKKTGAQPFFELGQEIEADWIAQHRMIGLPLAGELSVTGQPYVELMAETPHLDRDMALLGGLGVFQSYARNRAGSLYWHSPPMIEQIKQGRHWGYRVCLKLLISDNPVVPRLAATADPLVWI